MSEMEYLLATTAEEGAEVIQAATKAIRFGLQNHHPDRPEATNEAELLTEVYQLVAVVEMLQERGLVKTLPAEVIEGIKATKKEKVSFYMQNRT